MLTALLATLALAQSLLLAGVWLLWRGERREHHFWRGHARHLRGELQRAGKVAQELAARVAAQAELLAKRAEKGEVKED